MAQETQVGFETSQAPDGPARESNAIEGTGLFDSWSVGAVDFTVDPPASMGATLTVNQSQAEGGHARLGNGQSVAFTFQLAPSQLAQALDIALVGLVSRHPSGAGYAPVTLTINGVVCAQEFAVPGGGWGPQSCIFHVPPAALQPKRNTVNLTVLQNAQTFFWIYSLGVRQSPTPYSGNVLSAQFSSAPPAMSSGLVLAANDGVAAGDHATFDSGTHCVFSFALDHTNARTRAMTNLWSP